MCPVRYGIPVMSIVAQRSSSRSCRFGWVDIVCRRAMRRRRRRHLERLRRGVCCGCQAAGAGRLSHGFADLGPTVGSLSLSVVFLPPPLAPFLPPAPLSVSAAPARLSASSSLPVPACLEDRLRDQHDRQRGVAADVQQVAPEHRGRVADGVGGAHTAISSGVGAWAAWPVSARKTSSRSGDSTVSPVTASSSSPSSKRRSPATLPSLGTCRVSARGRRRRPGAPPLRRRAVRCR